MSTNDLINAIGALCEMCGVMREMLMENGFTRKEAVALVGEYINTTMKPKDNKEDN